MTKKENHLRKFIKCSKKHLRITEKLILQNIIRFKLRFLPYVFLIPKINFTIPLKGFGTFFTTIVMLVSPYLSNIFLIPVMINPMEIMHNHAVGGKMSMSNIPIPAPKIQPAIIFLHFLKNISLPP